MSQVETRKRMRIILSFNIINIRKREIRMDIKQLLKKYRNEAGMTQQEVADKIHVSRNTYTQYENGTRRIDIEMFVNITEALGVQLSFKEWKSIENKIKDLKEMKREWEQLREEFFQAMAYRNHPKVKELLEAGLDPNIRDENNERAFISAVKNGAYDIVATLLTYNIPYKSEWDYEWEDEWERPLTMATEEGHYGVVREILKWGRCPDDEISYGPTPLQKAFLSERYDLVRLLMSKGADINIKWYHGSIVQRLIEKKNDNMLLFIKERYYNDLDEKQTHLLDSYINENNPTSTRKIGHKHEWAWGIYDSKEYDHVKDIMRNNFHTINMMDEKKLLIQLTEGYRMRKGYLYALAFYSFTFKEPIIYKELKELVMTHLENGVVMRNMGREACHNLRERLRDLPVYQ